MSKRLIYAEDAIEALHDEIVRRRIDEDTNDDGALDEFDTEAIIKDLPSAQPQDIARYIATIIENEKDMRVMLNQHWILVSERLPDEWKRVLIQNDEGLFLVGFVKDRGWGKEWFYQYEMYDYDAYIESEQGKIVAWCELPDRWKGEQG